jgi:hypothetical protein
LRFSVSTDGAIPIVEKFCGWLLLDLGKCRNLRHEKKIGNELGLCGYDGVEFT